MSWILPAYIALPPDARLQFLQSLDPSAFAGLNFAAQKQHHARLKREYENSCDLMECILDVETFMSTVPLPPAPLVSSVPHHKDWDVEAVMKKLYSLNFKTIRLPPGLYFKSIGEIITHRKNPKYRYMVLIHPDPNFQDPLTSFAYTYFSKLLKDTYGLDLTYARQSFRDSPVFVASNVVDGQVLEYFELIINEDGVRLTKDFVTTDAEREWLSTPWVTP